MSIFQPSLFRFESDVNWEQASHDDILQTKLTFFQSSFYFHVDVVPSHVSHMKTMPKKKNHEIRTNKHTHSNYCVTIQPCGAREQQQAEHIVKSNTHTQKNEPPSPVVSPSPVQVHPSTLSTRFANYSRDNGKMPHFYRHTICIGNRLRPVFFLSRVCVCVRFTVPSKQ